MNDILGYYTHFAVIATLNLTYVKTRCEFLAEACVPGVVLNSLTFLQAAENVHRPWVYDHPWTMETLAIMPAWMPGRTGEFPSLHR